MNGINRQGETISMDRTYQLHDVERAKVMLRKIVGGARPKGGGRANVRMCIGSNSKNLSRILNELQDCTCDISLSLIVSPAVVDVVQNAICNRDNINIVDIRETDDTGLNFVVTDAGFYLQEGFGFEDAMASFNRHTVKSFLIQFFERLKSRFPEVDWNEEQICDDTVTAGP